MGPLPFGNTQQIKMAKHNLRKLFPLLLKLNAELTEMSLFLSSFFADQNQLSIWKNYALDRLK